MSYKPAIVVAAYNRPHALKGLLESLLRAEYDGEVSLVISIDGGGGAAVVAMAEAFEWPYGTKTIVAHATRLGVKGHILSCGGVTQQYGSIILLEDDLEVAPGFYRFAQEALQQYGHEEMVAGVSLYGYQITENDYRPFKPIEDGLDTYLMQFPSSWGQAWTAGQWQRFQDWLALHPQSNPQPLPPFVGQWGNQSWKKLFVRYMLQEGLFFVFPKVSFTTNKGYAGAHFAMQLTLFEVPLHSGEALSLPSIESMQRYNVNFAQNEKNASPIARNVAYAEYDWRIANGTEKPSLFGKWLFVARYHWHNYLIALRRKFQPRN